MSWWRLYLKMLKYIGKSSVFEISNSFGGARGEQCEGYTVESITNRTKDMKVTKTP